LKLCIQNNIKQITQHANYGFNRVSGGFLQNRRNVTTSFATVFDYPAVSLPFFLDPAPRSNHCTDSHALDYGLNDVFPCKDGRFGG